MFYPDSDKPWGGKTCADYGGTENPLGFGLGCVLPSQGDELSDNTFKNNGFFGNQYNADIGEFRAVTGVPRNCFSGNKDGTAAASSVPAGLEQTEPTPCDPKKLATTQELDLLYQVGCDTGLYGLCPKGANYPRPDPTAQLEMRPLPKNLPSMPDPCKDVPKNPWCP